jgi:spore coat polysaccharide biosynthesis protein SpsF (cytidylyltransferase family)
MKQRTSKNQQEKAPRVSVFQHQGSLHGQIARYPGIADYSVHKRVLQLLRDNPLIDIIKCIPSQAAI